MYKVLQEFSTLILTSKISLGYNCMYPYTLYNAKKIQYRYQEATAGAYMPSLAVWIINKVVLMTKFHLFLFSLNKYDDNFKKGVSFIKILGGHTCSV